jgi:hypothetical protein
MMLAAPHIFANMERDPMPQQRLPPVLFYISVGVPLALVLLAASPVGNEFFYVIAGIPLLLTIWLGAACWSLIICIASAMQRGWRSSLKFAVAPIAALIVCFYPVTFVRGAIYLGDVLHFTAAYPYYQRVVAQKAGEGAPRIIVFNWGGMVWASSGVVYDDSDEVSLPAGTQSAKWLASPDLAELGCGGFRARPLWSHYYLVFFPC